MCVIVATKLKDLDQYGNPEVGVNVTLVVDPATNPGNDFLSGSECTRAGMCTSRRTTTGIATFCDCTMHVIATSTRSRPRAAQSGLRSRDGGQHLFNIARPVKSCNGNCNVNAIDP